MNIVVFLGPTLPHEMARQILDATYLPPVAMGDVWALMPKPPRAIVIIDGVFERTPAVWHKEILWALSQGIRVFGSSSMGALRAAELTSFGMEGVGRIFEMFRDEVLEDDDEVAVAHSSAEHDFRVLSEAMVNIRHGLAEAESRGLISAPTRERLTAYAKKQFYAERSWGTLLQPGVVEVLPEDERVRLRAFVREERPDLKRKDAIALLEHVKALAASEMAPHVPTFTFEFGHIWRSLLHRETRMDDDRLVSIAAVGRHVRAALPERKEILRGAALLSALAAERELSGHTAPPTLEMLENAIDVKLRHQARIDRYLPLELERRGLLDGIVTEIRAQHAVAGPPVEDTERERAREWYEERHGSLGEVDLDDHAIDLRFPSARALLDHVARMLRVRQPH